jgi:hypothetical protein
MNDGISIQEFKIDNCKYTIEYFDFFKEFNQDLLKKNNEIFNGLIEYLETHKFKLEKQRKIEIFSIFFFCRINYLSNFFLMRLYIIISIFTFFFSVNTS